MSSVSSTSELTTKQIVEQVISDYHSSILPYLGAPAQAGFTPVGTVISVMGKTAPANYLVCDGTEYNIVDYPILANYFANQFGESNYFGGDGTTTFAVPDLRGEFLRGSGTNSHTNQGNGSAVGTHQDATNHANNMAYYSGSGSSAEVGFARNTSGTTNFGVSGVDKTVSTGQYTYTTPSVQLRTSDTRIQVYTSRPTNTSVLYCIATHNIYMNPANQYSTEEQVIGTWIDGKPLYQKTVKPNLPATVTDGTAEKVITSFADLGISNPELGFVVSGVCVNKTAGSIASVNSSWIGNYNYILYAAFHKNYGGIYISTNRANINSSTCDLYVTVQYTKTTDA